MTGEAPQALLLLKMTMTLGEEPERRTLDY
jgi:hypothetical protein